MVRGETVMSGGSCKFMEEEIVSKILDYLNFSAGSAWNHPDASRSQDCDGRA